MRKLKYALEAAIEGAQGLHVTLSDGLTTPSSPDVDGTAPQYISPPKGGLPAPNRCQTNPYLGGSDLSDSSVTAAQRFEDGHVIGEPGGDLERDVGVAEVGVRPRLGDAPPTVGAQELTGHRFLAE